MRWKEKGQKEKGKVKMLRMYDFKCQKCGKVMERIVQEDEHPKSICCGTDSQRMPPICRVNMGAAGSVGYYDETLGSYVSTNSQRRELMRQQGVTEKGGTPKPDGDAWV